MPMQSENPERVPSPGGDEERRRHDGVERAFVQAKRLMEAVPVLTGDPMADGISAMRAGRGALHVELTVRVRHADGTAFTQCAPIAHCDPAQPDVVMALFGLAVSGLSEMLRAHLGSFSFVQRESVEARRGVVSPLLRAAAAAEKLAEYEKQLRSTPMPQIPGLGGDPIGPC